MSFLNLFSNFFMSIANMETDIKESVLYEIWKKQNFRKSFKTADGLDIEIIDKGIRNGSLAGPDFKNARIRIGNITYVGDIEIDSNYSDWKSHGHHIDNKYSKVILHASLQNKNGIGYVFTRDGRKVPSICISEYVEQKVLYEAIKNTESPVGEGPSSLKCTSLNSACAKNEVEKYLYDFGVQRFEKKCKKIFDRLKEVEFLRSMNIKEPLVGFELSQQFQSKNFKQADFVSPEIWQQVFYEMVFEALGYTKNKRQMMELARNVNLNYLRHIEKDGVLIEKFEALLFNISGLMQSEQAVTDTSTKQYIERTNLHWNSLKAFYDGKFMDESQWHFFKMRPQNFPTIRIAGGVRILSELLFNNLMNNLIKKITEIHNHNVLINTLRSVFIVKSDGFWKNHYVLDSAATKEVKYFIGANRADEIVVNVVIPFFAVYFDIFANPTLSKKVFKLYTSFLQKEENIIVKDVSTCLNMVEESKRTIISQGMIELYRNMCSKNRCLECLIGKVVFN